MFLRQKQRWLQKVELKVVISSLQFALSFDGKTIVDEQSANFEHNPTSLGIYDSSPFTLGGHESSDGALNYTGNNEVERFDFDCNSWNSIGQFPFASQISSFSTVTIKNVLYIFG